MLNWFLTLCHVKERHKYLGIEITTEEYIYNKALANVVLIINTFSYYDDRLLYYVIMWIICTELLRIFSADSFFY